MAYQCRRDSQRSSVSRSLFSQPLSRLTPSFLTYLVSPPSLSSLFYPQWHTHVHHPLKPSPHSNRQCCILTIPLAILFISLAAISDGGCAGHLSVSNGFLMLMCMKQHTCDANWLEAEYVWEWRVAMTAQSCVGWMLGQRSKRTTGCFVVVKDHVCVREAIGYRSPAVYLQWRVSYCVNQESVTVLLGIFL